MVCYIKTKINFSQIIFFIFGLFVSIFLAAYMTSLWEVSENHQEKYVLDRTPTQQNNIQIVGNRYIVLDDDVILYTSFKNPGYYNYLLLNISSDDIAGRLKLYEYDDFGGVVNEHEIELDKSYTISLGEYSYIGIELVNIKGKSFVIEKMQFRTELEFSEWVLFAVYVAVFLGLYLILAIGLKSLCKYRGINFDSFIVTDFFIYVYCVIRRTLFKEIKYNNRYAHVVYVTVTALFILIFYKMYSIPYDNDYFGLVIWISVALLVIAKLLSKDNNIEVRWNNSLAMSWFVLSIIMIVSEIYVGHTKGMVGYFNLFVLGPYFYITGKSNNIEKQLEIIKLAILITFIPCIIKCLFFYDLSQGVIRYAGIYGNSNQFAAYVIVVFAVVIANIDHYIEKGEIKGKVLFNALLLGFATCFLWLTQSRTTLVAALLILSLALFKFIVMRKKYVNKLRTIIALIIIFLVIPVVWIISIWSINNISLKDSEQKIIVEDINNRVMVANASENSSRIVKTLKGSTSLKQFSNGRFEYWMTHIRNMNLLGHKDYSYVEMLGDISPSHNAVIGMMYKYGLLAGIPYIIMLLSAFCYALKYFINNSFKSKNAMLLLNIVTAFILCAMLDTMDERPFWRMLWIVFYLMVGFLMNMGNVESEDKTAAIKMSNHNKIEKLIILAVMGAIMLSSCGKFVYGTLKHWQSISMKSSVYTNLISDDILEKAPFQIVSTANIKGWESKEKTMPKQLQVLNPDYLVINEIHYVYYYNPDTKGISLVVSNDGSNWELNKEPVLRVGNTGAFDDTEIVKSKVVHISPYYYMLYIGKDSHGKTNIGLALSYDGIKWTKKNVRGSLKAENIKDIYAEYDINENQLNLKYMSNDSKITEVKINVAQNRDKTVFSTESDWAYSVVPSNKVLKGSYIIEGEKGSKSVWMQKKASLDLYHKNIATVLRINGYIPMDMYKQNNIERVKLIIKVNGEKLAEKIYYSSEVFVIDIPIDNIEKDGDYMHIELIADKDFNLKKMGVSEDGRDLSYILYSIMQQ